MTTVHLYWFRQPSGSGNFGDEIGPWLLREFSPATQIRYYDPLLAQRSLWVRLAAVSRSYLRRDEEFLRRAQARSLVPTRSLLTVGSIIKRARSESTTVWGSGALSQGDLITAGHFAAVRGHCTRELLQRHGLAPPEVVGDPGLLVPLIFRPTRSRDFSVGIIPHFRHYGALRNATPADALMIDVTWKLQDVVAAIARCDSIISTSLHGIIIAHALGVPAQWASFDETTSLTLDGDNTKFQDYFSSLGWITTEVTHLGELQSLSARSVRTSVRGSGASLPSASTVRSIQRDLLLTAPFPVKGTALQAHLLADLDGQ